MNWKEIELQQTCGACPEQYDAYYKDSKVGYLRLRHGNFTIECGETLVYQANPKGNGLFESEEREYYLKKAKKKISKHHNL